MDDTIKQLLGDDFTKSLISDLGLQDDTPEAQAYLLAQLGENIFEQLTLELLSALPESEYEKFKSLTGSGDMQALRVFLEKHIPDLDRFIQEAAKKEYEATKALMDA